MYSYSDFDEQFVRDGAQRPTDGRAGRLVGRSRHGRIIGHVFVISLCDHEDTRRDRNHPVVVSGGR